MQICSIGALRASKSKGEERSATLFEGGKFVPRNPRGRNARPLYLRAREKGRAPEQICFVGALCALKSKGRNARPLYLRAENWGGLLSKFAPLVLPYPSGAWRGVGKS